MDYSSSMSSNFCPRPEVTCPSYETVNLLVAVSRLSTEAVIAATVAKGYGEGYRVMDWWRPSEGEEF